MLGSWSDADDALQESWLRISKAGAEGVSNLGGWMTTITARVCLDMLRARKARREDEVEKAPEPVATKEGGGEPGHELFLADSIGLALLVVLETLDPVERVAFVLHDMFDLPFDDIANIVGRSPAATRQLASRARRRVRGEPPPPEEEGDPSKQRAIVDAFLTAARGGDVGRLVALLAPDVVLTADTRAVEGAKAAGPNAPRLVSRATGPDAIVNTFAGRARAGRAAMIGGQLGVAWAPDGVVPRAIFIFTTDEQSGLVAGLDVVSDMEEIARLDVKLLAE